VGVEGVGDDEIETSVRKGLSSGLVVHSEPRTNNTASSSVSKRPSRIHGIAIICFHDHDIRYWVPPDTLYVRHTCAVSAHW
jgi:hypothetical protein